jgi:hypothetical protein
MALTEPILCDDHHALTMSTANLLTRLANRYGSDKGSLHRNRHGYTYFYEDLLRRYRFRRFTLVEIGLLHLERQLELREASSEQFAFREAPSLQMWRRFFPFATLVGFDNQKFLVEIRNCTTIQGDQGNREDLGRISSAAKAGIQIIIDDASHASHHQQISLGALFPDLRRSGLYIVEDLNCELPKCEPAGALRTFEVLQGYRMRGTIESPFMTDEERRYLTDNIERIHYFSSLTEAAPVSGAVIVKKKNTN